VVFDELVDAFGGAVLEWADVGCDDQEAGRISRDLATIVDGFGGAGLAYPRAWAARWRANRWAGRLVRDARQGLRRPHPDSALGMFSGRHCAGLSDTQAAVELLNVLRPTVAVAWLGTFAALALHQHPEYRERLADERADTERELFAQEVRRFYPFVPALAGRLRCPVSWDGTRLRRGARIVLDVVGTNHDPGQWEHPETFSPERFEAEMPNEYQFVPQGGGRPQSGHRCPGEPLAVELLKATIRILARVDYDVAPASLRTDERRIPTTPAGGLALTDVRLAGPPRRGPGNLSSSESTRDS
jgi:fatty-acid peroxygenase